jgi:Tol biopolymer transport system component
VAFAAPTLIAELASSAVDRDPFLSSDGLTIYFSTERNAVTSGDVYTATRTSLTAPFGAPQQNPDISSVAYESRFSMTSSELIAVVASNRLGGEGDNDLWISTRANTSDKFANFSTTGLSNINSNASELDPEISADGLRIYLAIGNPQRIVVSERPNLGSSFGSSKQIAELFSNKGDADPSLSLDERIIVFASARDTGNTDLFYATRADKDATFSTPVRLAISSAPGDGDPFLSSDGCRLYFASDRSGNWELYVASVTPQQ